MYSIGRGKGEKKEGGGRLGRETRARNSFEAFLAREADQAGCHYYSSGGYSL